MAVPVPPHRLASPLTPGGVTVRPRLSPPATVEALLPRQRLFDLLDEDVSGPITAVIGPAGSGKTSLLAAWQARTALPVAWLSLDEGDRDLVPLWRDVVSAVESVAPGRAHRAATLLTRRGGRDTAVPALLDDLRADPHADAVLVLDDLGVADQEPDTVHSLGVFLQGLPPWLHVVASSRRDLPLPSDRLRARGQLREIRFAELRFSDQEAGELMRRFAPEMGDEAITRAVAQSDGWAASLRLTALAARTHRALPEPAVPDAEGQVLVSDYVWNEVLDGESDELVDTLRSVSVVERADAGLAAVLAGRSSAARDLATAEARGLFVSRVAGTGWFTLHALVRQVLVADLTARAPDRVRELHDRAARWYEDHDEIRLALEQWLADDQPREALRLLASGTAGLYDRGREAVIARTLRALPIGVATHDLQAMAEYAWCHLLIDRHRFLALVDELVRWAGQLEPDRAVGPPAVSFARVELLRCIASTIRGDWQTGGRQAREALARLGPQWWLDPLGRFGWNMVAREIALSERWDDLSPEVTEIASALSVDPDRRTAYEGTRALGQALAGDPLTALETAAATRRDADVANMSILRAELTLAESVARRELGDREAAIAALSELVFDRGEATPHVQVAALLELSGAYLDTDDLDEARKAFAEAEDIVRTDCTGTGTHTLLARTGTLLALAEGELEAADAWVAQTADDFWAGVGGARVRLARSDPGSARETLEALTPRSGRQRVVQELLLARVSTGPEATKRAIDAVELASARGLIQTVASEGAEAVEIAERAAWRAPALWLDRLRRAATPDVDPTGSVVELIEALTDRERDVLRLLPTRLTLHEIADELGVSTNTLKFHLRGIYRKLDCGSRAEAASLGLALARAHRARHRS